MWMHQCAMLSKKQTVFSLALMQLPQKGSTIKEAQNCLQFSQIIITNLCISVLHSTNMMHTKKVLKSALLKKYGLQRKKIFSCIILHLKKSISNTSKESFVSRVSSNLKNFSKKQRLYKKQNIKKKNEKRKDNHSYCNKHPCTFCM